MFIDLQILYHPQIPGTNPTYKCDLFNIFLNAVCQYFVEDFIMYFHQRYWPELFFLCCVFIWFWDLDDSGFIKNLGVFHSLGFFGIVCEG